MKEKKFVPPVEGIVLIAGDIHCKSPEALKNVLKWLETDYDIKDCSKDETHPSDSYFATLKESVKQSYAKCNYCGGYSTQLGCRCHGYKCDKCGKVLFRKFIHRAPVRLSFTSDKGMRYLNFLIHSYDEESQRLLVYAKPQKCERYFSVPLKDVPAHLAKHEGEFERVEINGKKLLSFYYPVRGGEGRNSKICVCETGHAPYKKTRNPNSILGYDYELAEEDKPCHYQMVQVFKGQEFAGEFGTNLPVDDMVTVLPTYKHAPAERDELLSRKILHTARQVADCGYYYQDGRPAFGGVSFEWMALYVEHFTDLDAQRFRRFLQLARRDGPGFIVQLARYIEEETGVEQYVENRPNIGNLLIGFSKVMGGEGLTDGEIDAMGHAMSDEEIKCEWYDFIRDMPKRKKDE